MRVPVEIRDGPIVLSGVQHDQIQQRTDGETAPDPKTVVHLNLTDRHPLEVGSHRVHFPLVDTYSAVLDERGFCVVELGRAVAIGIVGHLVVVPDRDPRKLSMAQQKILIGAVRSQSLSVVVESVDLAIWKRDATDALPVPIFTIRIFVDVVSQMYDVVHRILPRRIAVSVEETEGEVAA